MNDIPVLRRPAFFDGQPLAAADLTAVQDYHRELLWLHQHTLHGRGIVSGFAVHGAKGAKTVTVEPGYAIDRQGRSIVLDAARTLDVPSVVSGPTGQPAAYYLTVGYVSDDDLDATVRSGVCGSSGAVRRVEKPLLRWQDGSADTDQDVVLASISVQNCMLAGAADLAARRSAIPERQPYIYAGQTTPAGTAWSLWRLPDQGPKDQPVGVRVSVNTSEAGFANTPRYSAQVIGSRVAAQPGQADVVLDGYVQVSAASSTGFDLLMTLPPGNGLVNPGPVLEADVLAKLPARLGWYVSWLGVED
jgi:hypothetical protein